MSEWQEPNYSLKLNYKIKDVAKKVGYKNQLHFSNEFKKFYGVSPKNYENQEEITNEKQDLNV
jgi:AraC-like DNA-binding protein